jgi:predicted metal-dependent peptidase
LLRRAWSETIPSDYSWMPPNRRHIWAGLYLPGVRSEGTGAIAIAVDCSGSVNARQLGLFETEIRSILEGQRPSRVHLLYFDTEVHKTEVYQAGQTIALTPVGGGGTNFAPRFRWLDERGIVPQILVFLTDLCGTFPKDVPRYPVLWASTVSRVAPFGQVIPMEAA